MDEKGLGLRLQNARKKAGLTQQQLCQQSGLSYSTLAKIERGAIKSPSIFTIQQIAGALQTSMDSLVGTYTANTQNTLKKRSKSGISFVYFDINGCLVRFYQRAFVSTSKETGVALDIVETTFWHYNDAVCSGEMSINEFNERLAKKFGVASFDWNEHYLDAIEPIQESIQLLKWVSEHYNFGLLSNLMPGVLPEMINRGILPRLDYSQIVESHDVGSIKPEDKIYQIANEKSGVEPQNILFIDDSRGNLIAAERFNWRVVWFDDYRPEESVERIKQILEF